jgi:hypothetical protein
MIEKRSEHPPFSEATLNRVMVLSIATLLAVMLFV